MIKKNIIKSIRVYLDRCSLGKVKKHSKIQNYEPLVLTTEWCEFHSVSSNKSSNLNDHRGNLYLQSRKILWSVCHSKVTLGRFWWLNLWLIVLFLVFGRTGSSVQFIESKLISYSSHLEHNMQLNIGVKCPLRFFEVCDFWL